MAAAKFQRVRTQFIAALGDPKASGGDNATQWGIWTVDPGPRGVPIGQWKQLEAADGVAPAGWKHDPADWWVEECASPPPGFHHSALPTHDAVGSTCCFAPVAPVA